MKHLYWLTLIAMITTSLQGTIVLKNQLQQPQTIWLLLSLTGQGEECSSLHAKIDPGKTYTIPYLKECELKNISISTNEPPLGAPNVRIANPYSFSINLYGLEIKLDTPPSQTTTFFIIKDANNQFVLSKKPTLP